MPLPLWLTSLIAGGLSVGSNILGGRAQNQALGQAQQNLGKSTAAGVDVLTQLLGQAQGNLAPFRAVSAPALQQATGASRAVRTPVPTTTQPGRMNLDQLLAQIPRTNPPPMSMAPVSGMAGGSVSGLNLSSLLGALGGGGAGNALGVLTPEEQKLLGYREGTNISFGSGQPVATGRFNRTGPSKQEATLGAEQFSSEIWNKVAPLVKSGQLSPQKANEIANSWWQQWVNNMKASGVQQDVISRSIQSQGQYFWPEWEKFISGSGAGVV